MGRVDPKLRVGRGVEAREGHGHPAQRDVRDRDGHLGKHLHESAEFACGPSRQVQLGCDG